MTEAVTIETERKVYSVIIQLGYLEIEESSSGITADSTEITADSTEITADNEI